MNKISRLRGPRTAAAIRMDQRNVASGPTADVFTEKNLQATYGGKLTVLAEAAEAVEHGDVMP